MQAFKQIIPNYKILAFKKFSKNTVELTAELINQHPKSYELAEDHGLQVMGVIGADAGDGLVHGLTNVNFKISEFEAFLRF